MFSYAKMFEKSALATMLHFARVTLTHQPHVPNRIAQKELTVPVLLAVALD